MNFKPLSLLESMPTGLEISFKYLKTCKGTKYKYSNASDKFNILTFLGNLWDLVFLFACFYI